MMGGKLRRRMKRARGLLGRPEDAKDLNTLMAVLSVLLREMGGLQGLADMVRVLLDETNPTSPTQRKIVLATLKVSMKRDELQRKMAAENRAYPTDARVEMTDEELDESIVETVVPILRKRRQLAALVLQAVGTGSSV